MPILSLLLILCVCDKLECMFQNSILVEIIFVADSSGNFEPSQNRSILFTDLPVWIFWMGFPYLDNLSKSNAFWTRPDLFPQKLYNSWLSNPLWNTLHAEQQWIQLVPTIPSMSKVGFPLIKIFVIYCQTLNCCFCSSFFVPLKYQPI